MGLNNFKVWDKPDMGLFLHPLLGKKSRNGLGIKQEPITILTFKSVKGVKIMSESGSLLQYRVPSCKPLLDRSIVIIC